MLGRPETALSNAGQIDAGATNSVGISTIPRLSRSISVNPRFSVSGHVRRTITKRGVWGRASRP